MSEAHAYGTIEEGVAETVDESCGKKGGEEQEGVLPVIRREPPHQEQAGEKPEKPVLPAVGLQNPIRIPEAEAPGRPGK